MSTYDKLIELSESKKTSDSSNKQTKENRKPIPTQKVTSKITRKRDKSRKVSDNKLRDSSRKRSSGKPRRESHDTSPSRPTRDEIQEFSFRLRDELKVKVQAEVPHQWQKELEEVSRTLDVKKLELYRFIFGEFLGKVKRKRPS